MTTCTCPDCGAPLIILVDGEKQTKRQRKRRNRWPWRWLDFNATGETYRAGTKQLFKTQAAAIAPTWQSQPAQSQISSAALGPGETVWRKLDLDDVRVPMLLGLAGFAPPVVAGTLIVGGLQLWEPLLWATVPIGIILVGADLVFWLMVWPHVRNDEKQLRMRERAADAVPETPPSTGKWKLQQEIKEGATTIYTEIEAVPALWHQFCKDVHNGRCNFSGAAAKDHEIDNFDEILVECRERRIVQPETVGQGKTPKLTSPRGLRWVEKFSTTPPPAAG
jgi:hypothetical protein